jgi:hypothetical protein
MIAVIWRGIPLVGLAFAHSLRGSTMNNDKLIHGIMSLSAPPLWAWLTGNKVILVFALAIFWGIPLTIYTIIKLFHFMVRIPRTPADYEG